MSLDDTCLTPSGEELEVYVIPSLSEDDLGGGLKLLRFSPSLFGEMLKGTK